MDKIHDKAAKLFDDIRKKKNVLPKNINTDSKNKNLENNAHSSFTCCIFCPKVFVNSRFLMKHLLRRHSDELVLFYRTGNRISNDFQSLSDILQKEFSNLKKELFSAKTTVDETFEAGSSKENQVNEKENIDTKSTNVILFDEFKELKDKMSYVEKDIHNLNDKFAEVDNVLKNDVVTKQYLSQKLILSEEKIMQAQRSQFIELKQVLSDDLKSFLVNQQEESRSEWKSYLLELRKEIKRLDYAIDNIRQQFTCTDSLKEEIKKELVPQIIPYISSKKCEENKRKTSIHKKKLLFNKSYPAPSQKEMFHPENFSLGGSNFKNHSETNFKNDDIAIVIANKLSKFSIPPNTSKLSSAEYNKIMKSLSLEKAKLLNKYGNFYEIFNSINARADQTALKELKHEKHCKIHFSKSLSPSKNSSNHSTSFEDNIHEQSNKLKCKKDRNITFSKPLTSSRNSLNHSVSFEDSSPIHVQSSIVQKENKSLSSSKNLSSTSKADFHKKSNSFLSNKNSKLNEGGCGDSFNSFSSQNMFANHAQINPIKDFETFILEDEQNCKNLNSMFIKSSSSDIIEHSSYKRKLSTTSPIKQRSVKSALHSNSVKFKETPALESDDKLSEFEDGSKDDFDDVSSLEAASFSEGENGYTTVK